MTDTAGRDWSLITVTYNSADQLKACWADAQLGNTEWIVVDNASTDDSVATARDLGATVIQLPRNVGFSTANNVGLEAAGNPWTGFVNPDISGIDTTSLSRLRVRAEQTRGLVAPQLLNPDGTEQPNARGLPFLVDKFAHRSLSVPGSKVEDYSRTGLREATYVAWVIGAAVLGATDLFRRLGGWDERFFLYYEDHDLGLRAWRSGVPVVLDPSVRWRHQWQRATSGRLRLRPWINEIRSGYAFYSQYPSLLGSPRRRPPSGFEDLANRLWSTV